MVNLLLAGVLDDGWRDILGVIGFGLTILGLLFAIVQIRRAVSGAEAAATAAREASNAIASNLELSSLATSVRLISEVETLLQSERFDAAWLRLNDLRELVVELRVTRSHDPTTDTTLGDLVALVASLSQTLLSRHYAPTSPFEPLTIHRRLGELSDFLSSLAAAGRMRQGG